MEIIMAENEKRFVKNLDYADLLRKMKIRQREVNPLFEKAFLDRNEKPASEYNLNTTTWD